MGRQVGGDQMTMGGGREEGVHGEGHSNDVILPKVFWIWEASRISKTLAANIVDDAVMGQMSSHVFWTERNTMKSAERIPWHK